MKSIFGLLMIFFSAHSVASGKLHLECNVVTRITYLGVLKSSNNDRLNVDIVESDPVKISSIDGNPSFVFHGPSVVSVGDNFILFKVLNSSNLHEFNVIHYETDDSVQNRYLESIKINRFNGEIFYSKMLGGEMISSRGRCEKSIKRF